MKNPPLLEKTVVEPAKLIGTKWIGWSEFIGDQMMVEFLDRKNCIYTSYQKRFPMTYTVTGNEIYISNIAMPFELSGKVLFNNGLPTFERVA